MTHLTEEQILSTLSAFQDPYLQKDWVSTKAVKKVIIQDHTLDLYITLGYPCDPQTVSWQKELTILLAPVLGNRPLNLHLSSHIEAHVGKQGVQAIPQIKNIIAVASGKGGVGKSLVAVNLALALSREGASVGLLDADIYGPSQPLMLGTTTQHEMKDKKTLIPIMGHGIQSMSMGYLINNQTPTVWRGPMISMALQQLLNNTEWQALDYLVVDLPPGTGDIQLTLAQKVPVSGALIVTTPQTVAVSDARRACAMFQKLQVPILGVVENMSRYTCPHCHHSDALFGSDGGVDLAQEFQTDLLADFPLDPAMREMTDSGVPPVIQDPNSAGALLFRELARKTAAKLSLYKKDYSIKFPKITVER